MTFSVLPGLRLQGRFLSIGITVACGLAFMLFGYDQGVFSGILSNPSFQEQFDHPDATVEGQIVSSYVLGCVIGAFMSMFLGDRLGRRKSIGLACALLTVGGVLQATAFTLLHMIVGRIVSGIGVGMNTTTVPIWQSETCDPKHRGILMSIQLTLLVFGFVVANWVNFAFTYIPDQPVAWRFPLAFQSVLSVLTLAIVPFMVESPRWLCLRGRDDEARDVLARLAVKPSMDDVLQELRTIQEIISHENESQISGWRHIFTNAPQQNFRRIALGAGANFMQQLGGINVVAYYLPVVLKRSFGFSDRMSLILSAVDSMQWMFWAGMASFVIDKVGRRRLLIFGSAGQSLCFAMAALGLGIDTKALNGVAVAFIFLYYFFFGLSFLVIPFMYPSEINSHHTRNLGSAIAMVTNWLGVYVIVSVTPTAIENIGWKYYLVFAITNFAFCPICWLFYVETSGLSLEEVDRLFEIKYHGGRNMTYRDAARKAKEVIHVENVDSVHGAKKVDAGEI
ncbi:sugar porter family MFS transporter [Aspergillus fischeri NRRL 181]|uniref:Hexose carrier protein n=1 Tax=Neosartorya fischeri (strain ATCC 1020 / DSM 3700 / CBS 544.65 / FGSC A1164 / JCM 1740 / NRRL 181 / WB 181) TaxID=331117 RepID=A1D0R8_NEOFI|nr:hexose carrier protein [Aspergillus fischeri NRRL 181]EAW24588.1 hexose carrier protein [Aspergillus fischeri NRRL 181]